MVVCAYTERRWDELVAAYRSLVAQTYPRREVILVIDHNEALFRRAEQAFPGATVIANRETKGLSGARNSGVREASGEVIAFLDDDAAADPDWLANLTQAYLDPRTIGAGGKIRPNWRSARPNWFPEEFWWVIGCTYRGMPETRSDVRNLIGANMSFRRRVFDQLDFHVGLGRVGTIPLSGEETDFCIRLAALCPDFALIYEPAACVSHAVTADRTRWSYFRSRCFAEGISKAIIAGRVGPQRGLASERAHAARILPQGVVRGLQSTLRDRNLGGLARAAAIVAGLAFTVSGYCVGAVRVRL